MTGYSVALALITLITTVFAGIEIPRLRRELRQFQAECEKRKRDGAGG